MTARITGITWRRLRTWFAHVTQCPECNATLHANLRHPEYLCRKGAALVELCAKPVKAR